MRWFVGISCGRASVQIPAAAKIVMVTSCAPLQSCLNPVSRKVFRRCLPINGATIRWCNVASPEVLRKKYLFPERGYLRKLVRRSCTLIGNHLTGVFFRIATSRIAAFKLHSMIVSKTSLAHLSVQIKKAPQPVVVRSFFLYYNELSNNVGCVRFLPKNLLSFSIHHACESTQPGQVEWQASLTFAIGLHNAHAIVYPTMCNILHIYFINIYCYTHIFCVYFAGVINLSVR